MSWRRQPWYPDIAAAMVRQDYDDVISGVRDALAQDGTAALTDAGIKNGSGADTGTSSHGVLQFFERTARRQRCRCRSNSLTGGRAANCWRRDS